MNIKEKERRLFAKWREERNYTYFLSDGLFCEEEWNQQTIKILYVLKEANWVNGDGDLCEFLLSEESSNYWRTWDNITRWTKAIRFGGEYPQRVTRADKTKCLKTITALNIKKVGGDAEADDAEISQYGESDAKYIKAQIELYQPDIIICCGRGKGKNADILYNYVFSEKTPWQEPIIEHNYFLSTLETGKTIPVVSFRHPQIRGGHKVWKKCYEIMCEIATELKGKNYI
jgi:hypothetical protein